MRIEVHFVESHVVFGVLRGANGHVDDGGARFAFVVVEQGPAEDVAGVGGEGVGHQTVIGGQGLFRFGEGEAFIIGPSSLKALSERFLLAHLPPFQRVQRGGKLADVHHLLVRLVHVLARSRHVERGEAELELLLLERHALEGSRFLVVVGGGDVGVVVAVVERENDVALVGAHGHHARVGGDDFGVAVMVVVVVNLHAVDAAAVLAFPLHINHVALNVLVKHPFLDVEGQFLPLHVGQEGAPFQGGYGDETVGDEEGQYAENQREIEQRTHGAPHGYARGFHGYQFIMLAKVAETHQQGQQQGQRQRHGNGRDGSVEQKFSYNFDFQTFANQIVHIEPNELHHPNEHHNEESEHKSTQKRLDDILVKFLHFR